MLPIFIPSYNRAGRVTTAALLEGAGVTHYKLVVRPEQLAAYAQHHPKRNLLAMDGELAGLGLSGAREYTRGKVKRGAWCLHIDDDMLGFIAPTYRHYSSCDQIHPAHGEQMITRACWQEVMNTNVDFATAYHRVIEDTMREAEKRGAALAGFSAHENPAFRAKKWTDVGYLCGGMMLMKNTGLPWRQVEDSALEDYALTVAHLYEHGRVLINKWLYPISKIYRPGGCGPYEERLPKMLAERERLMARYGAVFGIKNSKSRDGELRIRFNSLAQVEQWRNGLEGDPNYR